MTPLEEFDLEWIEVFIDHLIFNDAIYQTDCIVKFLNDIHCPIKWEDFR